MSRIMVRITEVKISVVSIGLNKSSRGKRYNKNKRLIRYKSVDKLEINTIRRTDFKGPKMGREAPYNE